MDDGPSLGPKGANEIRKEFEEDGLRNGICIESKDKTTAKSLIKEAECAENTHRLSARHFTLRSPELRS